MGRKGFTLVELMIVIAIIAVLATIAIPGIMRSQRSAHERSALTALKTLIVAEFDFQGNDRDENGVRDFWTGDVAGLFCITSCSVPGNAEQPIKLLDLGYAGSDSNPLADGDAGGEYRGIDNFITHAHKAGYWVTAMDADAYGDSYRMDTAGKVAMGNVHNSSRFAFLTFPESIKSTGQFAGIVSEEGAVLKRLLGVEIKPSNANPPGPVTDLDYINWPSDSDLKSYWSKLD